MAATTNNVNAKKPLATFLNPYLLPIMVTITKETVNPKSNAVIANVPFNESGAAVLNLSDDNAFIKKYEPATNIVNTPKAITTFVIPVIAINAVMAIRLNVNVISIIVIDFTIFDAAYVFLPSLSFLVIPSTIPPKNFPIF